MDVAKLRAFIWIGDTHGPKPYNFMWFRFVLVAGPCLYFGLIFVRDLGVRGSPPAGSFGGREPPPDNVGEGLQRGSTPQGRATLNISWPKARNVNPNPY